jgi:predicted transposase/invertase (TIGR01784 family)
MASKTNIQSPDWEKGKYINPYTDFGFKKLFGTEANKDFLQHFLQSLLHVDGEITQLKFLNSARLGRLKHERGAVFDIYCETDKGVKFIVEMQKSEQKFFKDRSVFYSTFPIQEQAKRGTTWNFELHAIYLVAILDFEFDDDTDEPDKYYYHVQLSDTETNKVFFNKLTFVYLEMPKFVKTEDDLETDFDKWLFVLKNLPKLQSRPRALQERVFQRLFQIAAIEQLSPKERRRYDESLKNYWDMQNVIDTAVEKAVEKADQEKENVIIEQAKALAEQAKALAEKEKALAEKENVIIKQEKSIAEQAKNLAEQNQEIEAMRQQLQQKK